MSPLRSWKPSGGTTSPSSSSSWTPFSSYYERIITRSPFFTSTTTPACWISGGSFWTGYPAAIVSVLTQLRPPVTQIFPVTTFTVWPQSELNNSSALVLNPLALKTACFPHKALKDTKWHWLTWTLLRSVTHLFLCISVNSSLQVMKLSISLHWKSPQNH